MVFISVFRSFSFLLYCLVLCLLQLNDSTNLIQFLPQNICKLLSLLQIRKLSYMNKLIFSGIQESLSASVEVCACEFFLVNDARNEWHT